MKSLIESSKLALEFNKTVKSTIKDKALHNSYTSLSEASIDKLIESGEWYKTELSKCYISEEDRIKYGEKLSSITEELKFRGIKIEEDKVVEKKSEESIEEGFYYEPKTANVKKIFAIYDGMHSAVDVVDFWRTLLADVQMHSGSKGGPYMADKMLPHMKKIVEIILYNAKDRDGQLSPAKDSLDDKA